MLAATPLYKIKTKVILRHKWRQKEKFKKWREEGRGRERREKMGRGGDRRGGKRIDDHKCDPVEKVFMKLVCTAH